MTTAVPVDHPGGRSSYCLVPVYIYRAREHVYYYYTTGSTCKLLHVYVDSMQIYSQCNDKHIFWAGKFIIADSRIGTPIL